MAQREKSQVVIDVLLEHQSKGAKLELPHPLTPDSVVNGYNCAPVVKRAFKLRTIYMDARMTIKDLANPIPPDNEVMQARLAAVGV